MFRRSPPSPLWPVTRSLPDRRRAGRSRRCRCRGSPIDDSASSPMVPAAAPLNNWMRRLACAKWLGGEGWITRRVTRPRFPHRLHPGAPGRRLTGRPQAHPQGADADGRRHPGGGGDDLQGDDPGGATEVARGDRDPVHAGASRAPSGGQSPQDGASGGAIPAIALTAYARREDRNRALSVGYQAHLAKPVEPTELITTILGFADVIGAQRKNP